MSSDFATVWIFNLVFLKISSFCVISRLYLFRTSPVRVLSASYPSASFSRDYEWISKFLLVINPTDMLNIGPLPWIIHPMTLLLYSIKCLQCFQGPVLLLLIWCPLRQMYSELDLKEHFIPLHAHSNTGHGPIVTRKATKALWSCTWSSAWEDSVSVFQLSACIMLLSAGYLGQGEMLCNCSCSVPWWMSQTPVIPSLCHHSTLEIKAVMVFLVVYSDACP